VLWMLNEGLVLAAVEDPHDSVSLTARVISVERECGRRGGGVMWAANEGQVPAEVDTHQAVCHWRLV
jgi:hypothetical protein